MNVNTFKGSCCFLRSIPVSSSPSSKPPTIPDCPPCRAYNLSTMLMGKCASLSWGCCFPHLGSSRASVSQRHCLAFGLSAFSQATSSAGSSPPPPLLEGLPSPAHVRIFPVLPDAQVLLQRQWKPLQALAGEAFSREQGSPKERWGFSHR